MNKTIKYATNGALFCGLINALLNALNQKENDNFNWNECIKAFAKGALVGGVGGLAIGAVRDAEMDNILIATGGTAGFIKAALGNYSSNEFTLPDKAKKVQSRLFNEFSNNLSEYPSINGSIIKGTAIHSSDVDIQIRFNKNADRMPNLRNKVEQYLKEKFYDRELVQIRSQNHSIGLIYDLKGQKRRIDVVPMREIENGKGDTYLYSGKNNCIKKTNAKRQNNKLTFTNKQKQIVKLLKGWKIDNNLQLSSIMIEHIVKIIFSKCNVPRGLKSALLFCIEYIAKNITTIRIVDPANTNNIISNSLAYNERISLQNFCYQMLTAINRDARNITDYFYSDFNF